MDAEDVIYRLFPDRDTQYEPGDQVNVVRAPDGRANLIEHPSGDYEVVLCERTEHEGRIVLRVGLRPRH
jgi:hypothetical protein